MSQSNPPAQTKSGSGLKSVAVVGLAVVAVLSLVFAGYTVLNPHTVTVTQQQLLTNTQSVTSVQTQTVTYASTSTWVSVQTVTNTFPAYGYGNGYGTCSYYGCYQSPYYPGYYGNWYYPGYYYGYGATPPCQYTGSSNSVSCSGYLDEASNGCTLLVVSTTNNPYPSYATTYVYEYYALHNLPANTPSNGAWVTVSGRLYQGYNTASNGASCPNNYIIVNSIS